MLKILLSTASLYPYSHKEVFSIAKDVGFDGLELVIDNNCLKGDIEKNILKLNNLINHYNLPVYTVHQPLFMIYWKLGVKKTLELTFNIASQLRCKLVTIHLPIFLRSDNSYPWWDNYSKQFLEAISKIKQGSFYKLSKFEKIKNESKNLNKQFRESNLEPLITVETVLDRRVNLGKRHFTDPKVLINYVLKHNLFITFDTTHHGLKSYNIEDSFNILKSRVINIHISNTKRRKHEPPYIGKIPLKEFLKFILKNSYNNFLTLEISPIALNIWSKRRVKDRLKRSINFCKMYTR
ncbi:MAG: sugar phosphate isomerase/epimerase [Candidatus Humimicrobiia bacterium]